MPQELAENTMEVMQLKEGLMPLHLAGFEVSWVAQTDTWAQNAPPLPLPAAVMG